MNEFSVNFMGLICIPVQSHCCIVIVFRFGYVFCIYQNLRSRFGIERYAYTESHIAQISCVCMYVCDQTPPKPLNRFA